MRRRLLTYVGLLLLSFLMTGQQLARAEQNSETLLIFAAASLKDVLDEIAQDFDASDQINISYGSSGTLARQIAQGAPADLFVSANSDWMDYLQNHRKFKTAPKAVAENQLVVAVRPGDADQELNQLLRHNRFAMGDPTHVPAGQYAKQALTKLNLWTMVQDNAVYGENVRVSLRKLSRGEVRAAIVYQSDLIASETLTILHVFNANHHAPINYSAALLVPNQLTDRFAGDQGVQRADGSALGQRFFDHLSSPETAKTFETFGFSKTAFAASISVPRVTSDEIDYQAIILLSLKVAFVAMLFAIPLAFAIAYILARASFRGKALVQALVMLPLVMPPVVTGYFLLVLFGAEGVIGQFLAQLGLGFGFHWTGAALAAAVMAFPLLVRPMRLSIEAIDTKLDQAAETLGASRWTRFRTIILPLSMPGILAGGILGFAKALGEFGATMTFVSNIPGETQTFSLAVYSLLQSPSGDGAALVLILVSASLAIAAVLLSEWMSGKMLKAGGRDA